MEIPPDVRIKAAITKGSVYYFKDESHGKESPSHYFVVINAEPLSDRILILVCASSQLDKIKKARKNLPPQTLIEVSVGEYKHFAVPTIFDCNTVYEKTMDQLIDKLAEGQLGAFNADMGVEIVDRLRGAVIASPLITREVKDILNSTYH